jgi:hypothetical protein
MDGRGRVRPAFVVLAVLVVAAAFVLLKVSQRPTGWVAEQSRYSATQRVHVPRLDACVQVKLSGVLKYQRSSAATAGDRHFRNLMVTEPAMETRYYASCARGADLIKLSRVHFAQAWAATDGRALDRRPSTFAAPLRGSGQYNTGAPIAARGVTGRGKICVLAVPSLTAQRADESAEALLHKVTVCGH